MLIVPRTYQAEAVSATYEYFGSNEGNPLICMPTGTGKSVVIAMFLESIYRQWHQQKVLVLTHVKELIQQNYNKLLELWPGAPAGINSAGLGKRDTQNRIVFAGIGSVAKCAHEFGHVDLILIDEAHLVSPTDTTMYRKFINSLLVVNPRLKIIGLTATPYRMGHGKITDEGGIFTDTCFDITNLEAFNRLIAEGYIASLVPQETETKLDLDGVHMRGGDFVSAELQQAVNKDEVTRAALAEALERGRDRGHWLVFASGVEHADTIHHMLQDMGETSVSIHSKSGTRDKDIKAFKAGHVRIAVNNNVLTTGFDYPCIDLILMLRPTLSPGLWVQMLGRGTRPCKCCGKHNCLVLDFAANTRRLGPINDPAIPRKPGEGGGPPPMRKCTNQLPSGECKTLNHPSVKKCINCDFEFPVAVKLYMGASSEQLIKGDLPVTEVVKVDHVTYCEHRKEGRPPSIRVSYYCNLQRYNEYVCLEHSGYASRKARLWWRERLRSPELTCPDTTAAALEIVDTLRAPTHLRIWANKDPHPEIMAHCYDGTAFGTVAASDADEGPRVQVENSRTRSGYIPRPSTGNLDDDIPF